MLATGDFTHPVWLTGTGRQASFRDRRGYLRARRGSLLSWELRSVASTSKGGKTRRVHLLLFLSSLESVRSFQRLNWPTGASSSKGDGRPTVGLLASELTWLPSALEIDSKAMVIPAHLWTPWYGHAGFSVGLRQSGRVFWGVDARLIRAVETGLSSDPAMNWGDPRIGGPDDPFLFRCPFPSQLGQGSHGIQGRTNLRRPEAGSRSGTAWPTPWSSTLKKASITTTGTATAGVRQSPQETAAAGQPALSGLWTPADPRGASPRDPFTGHP